jgi:hypothetical protein
MGIRPITSACFLCYSAQARSRSFTDRQTHVWCGDGIGGSSAPGSFAFPHLLCPGNAHVHPPDVQCSRGDLCPGQAAYGSTLRQPIGSQFREYLHAWRTAGPVEPDAEEDFSYKDEPRPQPDGEPGSPAIVGHPSRPLRLTWPGLHLSCSRLRPCSATIRPSFSL